MKGEANISKEKLIFIEDEAYTSKDTKIHVLRIGLTGGGGDGS